MHEEGVVHISLSRVQAMQERGNKMFLPPGNDDDIKKADLLDLCVGFINYNCSLLCDNLFYRRGIFRSKITLQV